MATFSIDREICLSEEDLETIMKSAPSEKLLNLLHKDDDPISAKIQKSIFNNYIR